MEIRTVTKEYLTPAEWSELFKVLGVFDQIVKANSISIKVNFASGRAADPNSHIITDIKKISNLILAFSTINDKALFNIVEADSTNDGFAYLKFEHLNLPKSLNLPESIAARIRLVDMSRDRLMYIYKKEFKYFDEDENKLWLSETYINSDFIVSLANLKSHSVTGYTGACKNLFGCLPAFDKSGYHVFIHKVINDIVLAKMPNLSIVDGFFAMEKNGPVSGKKRNLGYMIVSDNPYAADVVASRSVGLNHKGIKYLKYLSKYFGDVGAEIDLQVENFEKPEVFLRVFNKIGLGIQRVGISISRFGHRIHIANNPIILMKVIARPIIVKFIGIDKLQKIKHKRDKSW